MYYIAISNKREVVTLINAKEKLKQEIKLLEDDVVIENLLMYILGMQTQKNINKNSKK